MPKTKFTEKPGKAPTKATSVFVLSSGEVSIYGVQDNLEDAKLLAQKLGAQYIDQFKLNSSTGKPQKSWKFEDEEWTTDF